MQQFFSRITEFLMPTHKDENPKWFYRFGRLIIGLTLLLLPFTYDIKVPEVAGDPRWYLMQFSSGLLLLLWVVARFQSKRPFDTLWPLTGWFAFGLTIWTMVSLIDGLSMFRSWFFFKHFMGYVGLFSFMYILRHHLWYRHICWLLVIPIAFNTLLATLQFFDIRDAMLNFIPFWQHIGFFDEWRASFPQSAPPAGTFANKNLLASWLVLLTPLTMWFMLTSRTRVLQALSALLFALAGMALMYTRSRASWVAIIFMIVFMAGWFALNPVHRKLLVERVKPALLGWFAAAIALVIASAQFTSPLRGVHSVDKSVAEQFSSLIVTDSERSKKDFGPRIAYNLNGLHIVKDHWFNGVGVGAFHAIYPQYHDAQMETPHHGYNIAARPQRAHNDLMQAFIELGVPGGVLMLLIAFSMPWMAWQLSRDEHAEKLGLLPVFLTTGIAGLCVNAMLDFPLQMPTAPGTLWALMGMMTGLFVLYHPGALHGPKTPLQMPRVVYGITALLALVAFVGITADNLARRTAAKDLKIAMSLTMSGIFNDHTLNYITRSVELYPYNQRALEFKSVIYSNYRGSRQLSRDTIKQAVLAGLKEDPYAANNLVNLAGIYFKEAQQYQSLGQPEKAKPLLNEMRKIVDELYVIGPKNPHTWGVAGLMALTEQKYKTAIANFNKALELDPTYTPAIGGRNLAQAKLSGGAYVFENTDAKNPGKVRIPLEQLLPQLQQQLKQQAQQ